MGTLPTGGKIEIFLDKKVENDGAKTLWWALGKPLRKLKPGSVVSFSSSFFGHHRDPKHASLTLKARVVEKTDQQILLDFNTSEEKLHQWLDQWGIIPLPPYIKRESVKPAAFSPDRDRYQTVFAQERGSVAAPTAGLHFTDALLQQLKEQEMRIQYVRLHVGSGTFLPVKKDDISQHTMHHETYHIPHETIEEILRAKKENRPVIAVGTTSFRCLEDLYRRSSGEPAKMLDLADKPGSTDLFIHPKTRLDTYKPWIIDGLMTNFHQPQSTLLMLVASLIGLEKTMTLYRYAIENKLRFFSYGDTSLLWLKDAPRNL